VISWISVASTGSRHPFRGGFLPAELAAFRGDFFGPSTTLDTDGRTSDDIAGEQLPQAA
jgi:hypothetical protein